MSEELNLRTPIERARRATIGAISGFWFVTITMFVGTNRDYAADVRLLERAFVDWLPVSGFSDPSNPLNRFNTGGYVMGHPQAVVDSYGYTFQYITYLITRVVSFVTGTDFGISSEVRIMTQNIVIAATGLLGCIIVGRIIRVVTNSPRAELAALVMMAFTPLWVGHSWMNQKDIPFATGFIACTLLAVNALERRRRHFKLSGREETWLTACAVMLTFGTRPGIAVLTLPLFGLTLLHSGRLSMPTRPLMRGLVVGIVGTLATNPASVPNPIGWITSAISTGREFPGWIGQVLYFGKFTPGDQVGADYLFTDYVFQLPLLLVIGLLGACVAMTRAHPRFGRSWIPLGYHAVVTPVIVFGIASVNYNAGRQYLFVMPGVVTVAILGLHHLLQQKNRNVRRGVRVVLAVFSFTLLVDNVTLYPFQYVYRNEAFRTIPDFKDRFEFDYWGLAGRQIGDNLGDLGPGDVYVGSGRTIDGRPTYVDSLTIVPYVAPNQFPGSEVSNPVGAGSLFYWPQILDTNFRPYLANCRETYRATTFLWPERIALGSVHDCR